MSADNWAECPKCKEKYSIVEESTLREDYEIGIIDGEFEVNYSAKCIDCGFEFGFKTKNKALPS